ncbi:hypothetical protein ACJX0J_012225, partial [Zea mays]
FISISHVTNARIAAAQHGIIRSIENEVGHPPLTNFLVGPIGQDLEHPWALSFALSLGNFGTSGKGRGLDRVVITMSWGTYNVVRSIENTRIDDIHIQISHHN